MYSKQELYQLRNEIPITVVIADVLDIPSKMIDGYFRFLCPLCSEFMTATNSKTNLARCFRCQKNFNPIDITMAANKYTFKEAVEYLQDIKEKIKARENQRYRTMDQRAEHRSTGTEGGHPKSQI